MEDSTMENSKMIRSLVMAYTSGRMVLYLRDIGNRENNTEEVGT